MSQDPRAQAMFDKMGEQAMQALSSPHGAEAIARDAKTNGPAQAIVKAVHAVVDGISKAAAQAGVELPAEVVNEAISTLAKVLVAMMVQSGLADDAQKLMSEVEPQLGVGEDAQDPNEPSDPSADPAEDAREPAGTPPDDPQQGALMRARGA